VVVLTKIDKLGSSHRQARIDAVAAELTLPEDQVIPFSAITGAGRDELAAAIITLIEQPSWRTA
jgi:GTP-binding protein